MPWYVYFAHFFAGMFLTNGIPHFVNGISGRRFQTPFASPPAVGESSPIVNVLWGMTNIGIGLWLLLKVEELQFGLNSDAMTHGRSETIAFFAGAFLVAIALAWHFGRVRNP